MRRAAGPKESRGPTAARRAHLPQSGNSLRAVEQTKSWKQTRYNAIYSVQVCYLGESRLRYTLHQQCSGTPFMSEGGNPRQELAPLVSPTG